MIVEPYWAFHSQTRFSKASRPRSWRDLPSFASSFSTTACVPIPAWSVPRIHIALRPRMRLIRISTSWIDPFSAWPMCSAPVTLGGGIAIEKLSSGLPSAGGWNQPPSIQRSKTRCSTSPGSQRVVSSRAFLRSASKARDLTARPWRATRPRPQPPTRDADRP